mgnify:CR=1 FL=1
MKPITQIIEKRPWMAWLIFFITIVVVFLVAPERHVPASANI